MRQISIVWSPQGRHTALAATLDQHLLERVDAHGKHLFYCWRAAPILLQFMPRDLLTADEAADFTAFRLYLQRVRFYGNRFLRVADFEIDVLLKCLSNVYDYAGPNKLLKACRRCFQVIDPCAHAREKIISRRV